eukprot:5115098-Pleurochrysis_carterae.AAC.1
MSQLGQGFRIRPDALTRLARPLAVRVVQRVHCMRGGPVDAPKMLERSDEGAVGGEVEAFA